MRYLPAFCLVGCIFGSALFAAETPAKSDDKTAAKDSITADAKPAAKDPIQAEHVAFLQRLAICSKIRELAAANDDAEGMAAANRLENLATDLYQKKLKVLEAALEEAREKEARQAAAAKKKDNAKTTTVVEYAPNGRPIRKEVNQ